MRSVLGLALARLRDRPARGALTALGVALAAAMLVVTAGMRAIAGDLELRRSVAALAAGYGGYLVTYGGNLTDPATLERLDATARSALAPLGAGQPRRELLLRELSNGRGGTFYFGAVDGLGGVLGVRTGRAPTSCTPTRCEVVVVRGSPLTIDPSLGLVVVGTGTITEPGFFAGTFDPGAGATIIVADGVLRAGAVGPLTEIQRSIGWLAPVAPGSLRVGSSRQLLRTVARSAEAVSVEGMTFSAPDEAIARAVVRARSSSTRLTIVGAQAALELAAFAVLAAIGLRRDHAGVLTLLRRRGASRRQRLGFTLAEASAPALVGTVVGSLGGLSLIALVARAEHDSPRAILAEVLPPAATNLVAGLGVTIALVAMVLRIPAREPRRGLWPTDGVGLAALGAIALAAGRGSSSAASLAANGDPLVAALPILGAVAAGCLAVRLVGPALRLLAAVLPRRRAGLARLALLEGLRRPLRPLATVAFLVMAISLALLAIAYRSTLDRGARDQAVWRVPLDVTLATGPQLDRPVDVASAAAYADLVPGGRATAVLRRGATVHSDGVARIPLELLGIDPRAIGAVASWREDYGVPEPAPLSAAITPASPARLAGADLPVEADAIVGRIEALPVALQLLAVVEGRDGTVTTSPFASSGTAPVPERQRGGRLIGLVLRPDPSGLSHVLHHLGEGGTAVASTDATVIVRSLVAAGRSLDLTSTPLVASGGTVAPAAGGGVALHVTLLGSGAYVRFPQVTDGQSLPAIVDEVSARSARGGVLQLGSPSGRVLRLTVVGTAKRFPTLRGRFAIVDGGLLRVALESLDPGSGTPDEEWLRAASSRDEPRLAARLASAPFDRLRLARRTTLERDLRTDPLARAALALLGLGALIGVVLAIVALALVVHADRIEDAAELGALEADGVEPAALRRLLTVRGASLVLIATPIGVACGALLAAAVRDLVRVTAVGLEPAPPLIAVNGVAAAVLAIVATIAGGLVATAAAAAVTFREPLPTRSTEAG